LALFSPQNLPGTMAFTFANQLNTNLNQTPQQIAGNRLNP
jgi:hypothetical protein